MKRSIVTFFFFLFTLSSFSQNEKKIDSLKLRLKTEVVDSNRQSICSSLGWLLKNTQSDTALTYEKKAMFIAKKMKSEKRIAASYNHLGVIYWIIGEYDKAIVNTIHALEIYEKLGKQKELSDEYTNLSLIYSMTKNFTTATDYALKSIVIREKLKDQVLLAAAYQNLGYVFYQAGLKEKATESFIKAAKCQEKASDKTGLEGTFNDIAVIYTEEKKYPLALEYYQKSLALSITVNDKLVMTQSYSNMGQLYTFTKDYSKAKACFDKALATAKELQSKKEFQSIYFAMSDWSLAQDQYKASLDYFKLASAIKDSLINSEKNNELAEAQAKYEANEKDKEIQLLNKDKALKDIEIEKQTAEAGKQQTQRNAFILGFVLVLVLVGFVYRSYRDKKKDNLIIASQKNLVEEKQKEILDSIQYAKRIQESLLPTEKYIDKNLKRLGKK